MCVHSELMCMNPQTLTTLSQRSSGGEMQHYQVIAMPEINAAGGVRSSVSPAFRFFEIRYHKEQRGIFSCAPMCTRAKLTEIIFSRPFTFILRKFYFVSLCHQYFVADYFFFVFTYLSHALQAWPPRGQLWSRAHRCFKFKVCACVLPNCKSTL